MKSVDVVIDESMKQQWPKNWIPQEMSHKIVSGKIHLFSKTIVITYWETKHCIDVSYLDMETTNLCFEAVSGAGSKHSMVVLGYPAAV